MDQSIYESLLAHLRPWENILAHLQLLMLWHSPRNSAIFIGLIELILIYICFTDICWLFSLIFLIWLLLLMDCIRNYWWHSIEVPNVGDPRLMSQLVSVDELAKRLARAIHCMRSQLQWLQNYRRENRTLFYSCAIFILLNSACLGAYISARPLLFIVVNLLLWFPCALRFGVITQGCRFREPTLSLVVKECPSQKINSHEMSTPQEPFTQSGKNQEVPEVHNEEEEILGNEPPQTDSLLPSHSAEDVECISSQTGVQEVEEHAPHQLEDKSSRSSSEVDISEFELLEEDTA